MKRFGWIAIILIGLLVLAGMRWTMPRYERITGPIAVAGKPDAWVDTGNLAVRGGAPQLARTIRFKALGKVEERTSAGVWLVVPVRSRVDHATAHVYGRIWVTPDGRRYRASGRVEDGDVVLTATKTLQPGLERKDVVVFELPVELANGEGTLLVSEERDPQLTAQARITYPAAAPASPAKLLDLDELHAKL
ncbi:hypothetical protein [Sphingomonas sp.]|uniref:hypothetical protein n=1 Tax=Sphingomonas sp. TaxID=28214 RepID=UPI0031D003A2